MSSPLVNSSWSETFLDVLVQIRQWWDNQPQFHYFSVYPAASKTFHSYLITAILPRAQARRNARRHFRTNVHSFTTHTSTEGLVTLSSKRRLSVFSDNDDVPEAKKSRLGEQLHEFEVSWPCRPVHITLTRHSAQLLCSKPPAAPTPSAMNGREIFSTHVVTLFDKMESGVSYKDIINTASDAVKALPTLDRDAKADNDMSLYLAAFFIAQYGRVAQELKVVDTCIEADSDITPDQLEQLNGHVDRLYAYLRNDEQWQDVIPCLGLFTLKLRIVRDQIRSSKELTTSAGLAANIEAIEKLLNPPASTIAAPTRSGSPLKTTTNQSELETRSHDMAAEPKKKDEEIAAAHKVAEEEIMITKKLKADLYCLGEGFARKGEGLQRDGSGPQGWVGS
jgi:hypothetical protein